MKTLLRDVKLTRVRAGGHIMMGLLIGFLFFQMKTTQAGWMDRLSCVFFSLIFLLLTALIPTVLTFPQERAVFEKEHRNNWYGVLVYYVARSLVDIPFMILWPFVFALISYHLADMGDWEHFWVYALALILQTLLSQSLGLLIGSVAPTVPIAVFAAPAVAMPPLLLSGFFVNINSMATVFKWLSYASFMRYSFGLGAFAVNYDMIYHCAPSELPPKPANPPPGYKIMCPITSGTKYWIVLTWGQRGMISTSMLACASGFSSSFASSPTWRSSTVPRALDF
jgi:ABC-type multidrug transport system permease subunit